jgi:lipopolysaccharide assembly protein A
MRTVRLLILFAVMALWVWIAMLNFNNSADWTLPGIKGYSQWPVGLLMLLSFLIGAVPMWLMLKVTRWSWSRKLTKAEQKLADAATAAAPPTMAQTTADAEAALLARARAAGGVRT